MEEYHKLIKTQNVAPGQTCEISQKSVITEGWRDEGRLRDVVQERMIEFRRML